MVGPLGANSSHNSHSWDVQKLRTLTDLVILNGSPKIMKPTYQRSRSVQCVSIWCCLLKIFLSILKQILLSIKPLSPWSHPLPWASWGPERHNEGAGSLTITGDLFGINFVYHWVHPGFLCWRITTENERLK